MNNSEKKIQAFAETMLTCQSYDYLFFNFTNMYAFKRLENNQHSLYCLTASNITCFSIRNNI